MYPRLEINVDKLKNNVRVLSELCKENNLEMAMVTKSYCAIPELVEEIAGEEVAYLADSRVSNLKSLSNINIPKILLRIPMLSEVEEVVEYVDISFNSELETIYKLNKEAKKQKTVHKIVVMVDLGDLREGYFVEEELFDAVEKILKLENIKLCGLATNLTCYGAIIPSEDNLGKLVDLCTEIENRYNLKLDFLSGGNSSSIDLMMSGKMPKGITNLRLGEAIVLGRETAYGKDLEGTYQDAFKLVCEVVEMKEKPSLPIGEIGVDAFGNKPEYEDKGILTRAIVSIGKQDINIDSIIPVDKNIEILGASSDHMILNMSGSKDDYKVGSKVEFLVEYGGLMAACTSKYVSKELVYEEISESEAAY